ncbi:hypothetical protein [Myxosarcina sp. GI1(2024)]
MHLIGFFLSLVTAGFFQVGFAAFNNFDALNFLAPLLGGVVGAVGISLISALGGVNVPQSDKSPNQSNDTSDKFREVYLIEVEGTADQMSQAKEIIHQEGGKVGEESRR